MWKCKECKTKIIEDWGPVIDDIGEGFASYVCPNCLNFADTKEDIADWEEEDE